MQGLVKASNQSSQINSNTAAINNVYENSDGTEINYEKCMMPNTLNEPPSSVNVQQVQNKCSNCQLKEIKGISCFYSK